MGALAQFVRERLRLLRLLTASHAVVLGAISVCLAALPTLLALASGRLITRMAEGEAKAALAALAALLIAEGLAVAAQEAFRQVAATRVDGEIRRRLRGMASAPHGIAHLEDPAYADDLSRASNLGGWQHLSAGSAAVAQVVLMSRMTGAFLAAGVVAVHSPVTAFALLAAALTVRSIVRRQQLRLHKLVYIQARPWRQTDYWSEVSAGGAAGKEIRVFGLAGWAVRQRTAQARHLASVIWQTRREILLHQRLAFLLSFSAVLLAFLLLGLAVQQGALTRGELVTCLVASFVVLGMTAMGMEEYEIETGLGAVRAMDSLAARAPAQLVRPKPGAGVRFENVSFGYPDSGTVLDGLNLRIEPGEVLAIVGDNGAGKTTMIKLMAGLYEPGAGQVVSDPSRMAVMFQDFNRYPLSVADNVAMGAPEHRDDRAGIERALRRAGRDGGRLPHGIETVVSREVHDGVDLSGGQWQRLALARIFFAASHGRDLIVLDEPTAHLDVRAEADFNRDVVSGVEGATIVLISHRLSTVRHASRIVVMRGGTILEEGDHDSLMAAGGHYARMFELQAARFVESG
ncbi:ATP-binding cassette domain-containing protein [Nonomuraea turcica]|uniref:ATP-binding cassette domain-containing protein n=1 Tax=Nonomuraea sp. G32 TaxID=3067274 RepID=UPI00273CDA86|nr:ABC transporter ATP-binding protein [Nonomuraea sp. G32]MDP4502156.1 ABC transporter ATP-binding protein [Nonomuraea sp. G32]